MVIGNPGFPKIADAIKRIKLNPRESKQNPNRDEDEAENSRSKPSEALIVAMKPMLGSSVTSASIAIHCNVGISTDRWFAPPATTRRCS